MRQQVVVFTDYHFPHYCFCFAAASVQRSLNHEKTGQNQAAKNQVAKNQAEKNQVVESRAVPGVIASFSVIAVLVAVVVSVIIWRKRRPDLPPEKEQTAMI